jgi:hypothetical protein
MKREYSMKGERVDNKPIVNRKTNTERIKNFLILIGANSISIYALIYFFQKIDLILKRMGIPTRGNTITNRIEVNAGNITAKIG